jgi:hypothetical protein
MTPKQIDLARNALGLPNHNRRSYRNSFVVGIDCVDYDAWYDMAMRGLAIRYDGAKLPFGGMDLFKLTLLGASQALVGREALDTDDFR